MQDRAHCLTGNQPVSSNVTKNVISNIAVRSTFANKLLKNTKETKQGLVKICWEGTREKML